MFFRPLSTWLALFLLILGNVTSVHAQDSASVLLRALGRVVEATKSNQTQAQPGHSQEKWANQGTAGTWRFPAGAPEARDQEPQQPISPALSQHTLPPQDQARAIYEKAKMEGRSEEEAWIYQHLTEYVKQLHEAAAGPSQLAFKNLKVGAEFPMNINSVWLATIILTG